MLADHTRGLSFLPSISMRPASLWLSLWPNGQSAGGAILVDWLRPMM